MEAPVERKDCAHRSLLMLPPEVIKEILRNLVLIERNRTYEDVWGGMDWPYTDMVRDTNEFRDWWKRFDDMSRPTTERVARDKELRWARGLSKDTVRLDLTILRVCKSLHEEGVKIFHQENKFIAVFGTGTVFQSEGMKWPKFWAPSWRWDAKNHRFLRMWFGQDAVVDINPVLSLFRQGGGHHKDNFKLMPAADLSSMAPALAADHWSSKQLPINNIQFKFDLTIRANARPSDFGGSNQGKDDIIDYLTPRLLMWIGESLRRVTISVSAPDTVGDNVQICVDLAESIISIVQAWNWVARERQAELFTRHLETHLETIDNAVKECNVEKADRAFCRLCEDVQALRWHPTLQPTSQMRDFESISLTDLPSAYWSIYALACHSIGSLVTTKQTYPKRFPDQISFLRWALMRAEIPMTHLKRDPEWQLRAILQFARLLIDAGCTRWVVYDCIHTAAKIFDHCLSDDNESGQVQRLRDLKRHIPAYRSLSTEPESYQYPHPKELTPGDIAGIDQLARNWIQEVEMLCGEAQMSLSQFQVI
ncbi:hypothetical protein H2204_001415 [Knufia peltigerae]|uniref:Uncharacterized protein n=1 Tax=Knufia peltigerae TaxID=1002370 RepID=A0AA39D418_9EURO|nr:hypothetical protein H2204_001415 [Knufia peltigerae]